MDYQLLIFDVDGTLREHDPSLRFRGWQKAVEVLGMSRSVLGDEDLFSRLISNDWRKDVIENLGISKDQIASIERVFEDFRDSHIKLYPWVIKLIPQLHRKATLTAWSSSSVNSVNHHLKPLEKELGIEQLFYPVVGAGSVEHLKPHPEGGELILREYKDIPRDKVILVGDDMSDYRAAKALGIDFALVGWGSMDVQSILRLKDLKGVHFVFEPDNLKNLVQGPKGWLK